MQVTTDFLQEWLEKAKVAALGAGEKILEVYGSENFEAELKGDQSPLTKADKLAHHAIVAVLKESGLPILSEEGKQTPYEERSQWGTFWLVDPLDGTKEFIKRNGEFTVNIALVEGGRSIMGVVYVPVTGKMYYALKGEGAYLSENGAEPVQLACAVFSREEEGLKIVGSRSHMNPETEQFMAQYKNPEMVSMGSSLKFMLVAEGIAHIYPRIAPTMEWDTAAAQIVVEEAGGSVCQFGTKEPVVYNKENLLNPYFVVKGKEM
jgi:3'(2'), 5'-bisphosphate nucleotidase